MSRIGSQEITIPQGTEVTQADGVVIVKGPNGELSRATRPEITVNIQEGLVTLTPNDDSSRTNALWGTIASHIVNMIQGVNQPYEKRLSVEGVGYRSAVEGSDIVLTVGYTHPVRVPIPEGLTVTAEKNVISISGIDKESVGEFSARVRAVQKPEPYKGKGIRYEDEVVRRKEGKKNV